MCGFYTALMSSSPVKSRLPSRQFPLRWRLPNSLWQFGEKDGEVGRKRGEEGKEEREATQDLEITVLSWPLLGSRRWGGFGLEENWMEHRGASVQDIWAVRTFCRSSVLRQVGPANGPRQHQDWHEGVPEVWHQRDWERRCLNAQSQNLWCQGANRKVRKAHRGPCKRNDMSQFPCLFLLPFLTGSWELPSSRPVQWGCCSIRGTTMCLIKGITILWEVSF